MRAVDNFNLTVDDGELVCLLGPSGSGKSTLLRMVGGFERPTAGSITIDGEEIIHLPPERRPTGMVFQSHALWTHMNVFKNIAFGLKLRRIPADEISKRVDAVMELVGLAGYGNRQTHQLSGGQQQRVALARSLVLEPKILLLDEPFASLDQHLRERLREEVRDIQQRLKITTLFVTHGQDEALAHGRPHRRDARRAHRTDRGAGRALSRAGDAVRRRLHRHDEHDRGDGRQRHVLAIRPSACRCRSATAR